MEYSNLNHLMEGSSSCRTSSPFDEAAASPLLGKDSPKVKRWSLFGSKSSSLSSAAAAKDQESRLSTAYRNHDYCNNSNATTITTHSIEFEMSESSSSHIEEEIGNIFQLRFDNNNNNYADLDFAIMRERQDEISGINSSILQLHEIQKDLAGVVEEQDSAVQRLCDMADDAYGHVGTGLSHLYKVQQHYYVAARKDRTRAAVTAAVVVLLMVVAYCRAYAVANEDDSGLPQTDHP